VTIGPYDEIAIRLAEARTDAVTARGAWKRSNRSKRGACQLDTGIDLMRSVAVTALRAF